MVKTMLIKNKNDLDKLLKQIIYKTLRETQEEIYDAIDKSIKEYYAEYNPHLYKRTYKFLNSLVKTEIKQSGNELRCEVKIDDDYLRYAYPYPNKFNPSYPQDYDGRPTLGIDIVNWANRQFPNDEADGGNHGYTVDEGREDGFWDVALDELGGIISILKKNLKNQGIKIV